MISHPALAGFLSGYFHQDWDVEFETWELAALHFARAGFRRDVDAVIGEIESISRAGVSDERLREMLAGFGCFYWPSQPAALWLRSLEAILREGVS